MQRIYSFSCCTRTINTTNRALPKRYDISSVFEIRVFFFSFDFVFLLLLLLFCFTTRHIAFVSILKVGNGCYFGVFFFLLFEILFYHSQHSAPFCCYFLRFFFFYIHIHCCIFAPFHFVRLLLHQQNSLCFSFVILPLIVSFTFSFFLFLFFILSTIFPFSQFVFDLVGKQNWRSKNIDFFFLHIYSSFIDTNCYQSHEIVCNQFWIFFFFSFRKWYRLHSVCFSLCLV